jgi:hypothetical protein
VSELLARAVAKAAFKAARPLHELAELHVPFAELGFEAHPEEAVSGAIAEQAGLTLLVGRPGNGKSSVLARVANTLANAPASADRSYLPLFVPVAPRGEDAADIGTFGKMTVASLLAAFDDLGATDERALSGMTADQVTRQLPSHTFNADLAAKVFGTGLEGGVEVQGEVVTISKAGEAPDEYGGLPTLAQLLRARGRELIVIIEDTDGWTMQTEDQGAGLAQRFFGSVLAPLAALEVSVVVAVQTRWTETEEFDALNERALRRVVLPSFEDENLAETTIRRVITRRLDWALGGSHDASAAITDSAARTLAATLRETGSIRTSLTLLRDALDQLDGNYPDRVDSEHLVETA